MLDSSSEFTVILKKNIDLVTQIYFKQFFKKKNSNSLFDFAYSSMK